MLTKGQQRSENLAPSLHQFSVKPESFRQIEVLSALARILL